MSGFDPRRLAEVITTDAKGSGRRGTGYRVTATSVLTSAHVVAAAQTITVRFDAEQATEWTVPGETAWLDITNDLAILVIEPRLNEDEVSVAEFGRFSDDRSFIDAHIAGFPLWKLRHGELPGRGVFHFRDLHHGEARVAPASNRRTGRLEVRVSPPGESTSGRESPWEGMSGAPLWVENRIVGVITEHHRREGPSWLTAVRIDRCINAADEDRDRLTRLLGIPSGALELPEATDLQSIGSADEYGALLQILREAIGNKISSEEIGGQAVSSGVQSPPALYQLPSKVSDFIGRIAELNELRQHLLSWQDRSPAGVRISAISGKPGVGKSALAIQLANDLADEFSDGQLYVDLYGEEDNQLKPADVLIQFLKSLGISGAESDGETLGLLQARYRSALAHRRVLVVLDNAIDAAQVEPLIPTGKGCAVIVTSRPPLALLEGAHLLSLGVLSTDEAVHLLCSVSGRSETAEDSATLIRIAELCGNLPLALRIAAAKLKGRPHWSLARLADRLTDERRRLDELRLGHREVRASFRLSYSDLDNEASRAFRLLGLVPGKDFAPQALIPLLGLADVAADKDSGILRQVEDLVEQLVDAQLLETTPQRYKFHDLWGSRIWSPALSSSFMLPVRTR